MKKNNIRRLALFLAIAALASFLTACGGTKDRYDAYDRTGQNYDYDLTEYVAVPKYTGIVVPDITYTPSEEEIANSRVMKLAYFTPEEIVKEPCRKYDFINCSYSCTVDGLNYKLFDSSVDNSRTSVMVGVGSFGVPAVDDAIVGMSAGETKTVEFTFPEPFIKDVLSSGKQGVFTITVEAVRRMDFGEDFSNYTDDFVKEHYGYSSVAEYDDEITEQLTHDNNLYLENYEAQIAWDYVFRNSVVYKYPGKELNAARDNVTRAYTARAEESEMTLDEYLRSVGYESNADFYDNYVEPYARGIVKEEMILMYIARCEGFTVSDEEYESGLVEYCQYYEISDVPTCEKIVTRDFGSVREFREQLLRDKAHTFIAESVKKIDCAEYYQRKHDGNFDLTDDEVEREQQGSGAGYVALISVLCAAGAAAVALIVILSVRLSKAVKQKKAHAAEQAALEEKRRIRREMKQAKKKHHTKKPENNE